MDKLQEAIGLIKQGEKEQAREILQTLVDEQPQEIMAWFWLADTMPNEQERYEVLTQALVYHPDDVRLQKALSILAAYAQPPLEMPEEEVSDIDPEDLYAEEEEEPEQLEIPGLENETAQPEEREAKLQPTTGFTPLQRRILFTVGVVLVLGLIALGAWLTRDYWMNTNAIENPSVAVLFTETADLAAATLTSTNAVTNEEMKSTQTPTPTPTSTSTPTNTPIVEDNDQMTTAVVVTTPTSTPAVLEGVFSQVRGRQVADMAWSQDGRLFALAGSEGISIYDGREFNEILYIAMDPPVPVRTLSFSADGATIAAGFDRTGSGDEFTTRAKMWRVSDGAEVQSFDYAESRGDIDQVAFSQDGQTLFTNAMLDVILKWRTSDGALLDVYRLSQSAINYYGVVFAPDRRSFAVYSLFDRLRLLDSATGERITFLGDTRDVTGVAYSANSQYLAVRFKDKPVVFLWDISAREKVREFNTFAGNVTALAFNADNQTLAVATEENLIKFYQLRSGEEQRVISRQIPLVEQMVFAPDDILFAVRNDSEVQIWHLVTDSLVATFRVEQ
jgi:WD40 repeat protein